MMDSLCRKRKLGDSFIPCVFAKALLFLIKISRLKWKCTFAGRELNSILSQELKINGLSDDHSGLSFHIIP